MNDVQKVSDELQLLQALLDEVKELKNESEDEETAIFDIGLVYLFLKIISETAPLLYILSFFADNMYQPIILLVVVTFLARIVIYLRADDLIGIVVKLRNSN